MRASVDSGKSATAGHELTPLAVMGCILPAEPSLTPHAAAEFAGRLTRPPDTRLEPVIDVHHRIPAAQLFSIASRAASPPAGSIADAGQDGDGQGIDQPANHAERGPSMPATTTSTRAARSVADWDSRR